MAILDIPTCDRGTKVINADCIVSAMIADKAGGAPGYGDYNAIIQAMIGACVPHEIAGEAEAEIRMTRGQ